MPRFLVIASLLLSLTACPSNTNGSLVPTGRLYFPTGVIHVDAPGSTDGVLFVTNSNTDKRYSAGSLVAIGLDDVQEGDGGAKGLPPFGAPVNAGARQYTVLNTVSSVQVSSFTGELAKLELGTDRYRLFVPSRSEGMKFQAIDADLVDGGLALKCFPAAPASAPDDCAANAPSLSPKHFEQSAVGVPRATAPFGVAVKPRACTMNECGDGRMCVAGYCRSPVEGGSEPFADVYVTHLTQVDSPFASGKDLRGYGVRVDSDAMTIDETNFNYLGGGGTNSVAAGRRWVYMTGRYIQATGYPNLVRLVDTDGTALSSGLETAFGVADSRGVALGRNEERLYVLGRSPDVLLVVRLTDVLTAAPVLQLVRAVRLPNAPNELKVIPRTGRGDLVAITCSGAGSVVLYDEDVGDLVAQVPSVGLQPFAVDVDLRGAGARLFVSDFNDGRIAVIDVPDLARPQGTRLVAHIGDQQLCITRPTTTAGCTGVTK